jgi:molybdopterin converting factor small subunit
VTTVEQVVIEVRAFAAARTALGWAGRQMPVAPGSTVGDVVALLAAQSPAAVPVLGRCAALLDGRRVTDIGTVVPAGARLDLLPPFAGG